MSEQKALLTADWHLGKTYNGKSLLPFQERILNMLVDLAIEQNVNWFIIAGDVYDKRRPNKEEIHVLENLLRRLNDAGINIVIIAGNHDGEVLTLYSSLLNRHSDGKVHLIRADSDHTTVPSKLFELNGYSFYALPYIDRPTCLQLLENKGIIIDDQQEDSPLDLLIQHWVTTLENPHKTILITHILPTSLTDTEAGTDEVVGQMMPVKPESFRTLKGVLSGHIHRPLTIEPNITFVGAPYHLNPLDKYEPSAMIITVSQDMRIGKISYLPTIFQKITINKEEDLDGITALSPHHYYIFKIEAPDNSLPEHLHKQLIETLPENITSSIKFESGSIPVKSFAEASITHDLHQYTPISLIQTYVKEVHGTDLSEEEIKIITEILKNLENDEAM